MGIYTLSGVNAQKENHKKNDYNGRKRKNRRIFDLQTNHKTMKTNIEVTPNHPAHQQVIEFMTELLPKVEMAKTEFDALQVVRENCLDTPFFWGAGGHHIWIHHNANPNERVAIIRY